MKRGVGREKSEERNAEREEERGKKKN